MFAKLSGGILVGATLLSGCAAVGPDYTAPIATLTPQYVNGGAKALRDAPQEQWWEGMTDAKLDQFIQRGMAQNLDIEASYERIRAAQASVGRTGLNAQLSGNSIIQASRNSDQVSGQFSDNGASLNSGVIFDIFGGFRRGREQAIANFEASQFDVGTVRLAYLSDIIDAYVNARYFQRAANITQASINSRQRTLSLVRQRREAGEATELEVQQARAQLNSAKANLPFLNAGFETQIFRIATLLAEPAGPIMVNMKKGGKQPIPLRIGAAGVPVDLLRNRPDIRRAERNFAAATASVGVAEAQLYPSLSLNGAVTEGTRETWTFGPTLSLPLLTRGFLKANRNIAISEALQAQIAWRSTVLFGVEDVQSNLSQTRHWNIQLNAHRAASSASGRVLSLSREAYADNAITLTEVLDAERSNFADQLALAAACRDYALSWSRYQIATGRGWYANGVDAPAKIVLADGATPAPTVTSGFIASN